MTIFLVFKISVKIPIPIIAKSSLHGKLVPPIACQVTLSVWPACLANNIAIALVQTALIPIPIMKECSNKVTLDLATVFPSINNNLPGLVIFQTPKAKKPQKTKFNGGTVFINHVSGFIYVPNQVSL